MTTRDGTARQSEPAHVASRVRPMTTNAVLQEILISNKELGKKPRQSVIKLTEEMPQHSKLANPIVRFLKNLVIFRVNV